MNVSKISFPTPIHILMLLLTRSQNSDPDKLFVLIINNIDYVVCDCGVCYFECAKGSTFWSVVVGRFEVVIHGKTIGVIVQHIIFPMWMAKLIHL
jgi:hypothetical protein